MNRGNIWQIAVVGTLVAMLPLIVDYDTSTASQLTTDIGGVLTSLSPVVGLLLFVVTAGVIIQIAFPSGGGF